MKKIICIALLAFGLASLSGCDQPDKDAIISSQAQQIAALQQQTCAPPAVQSTAAGVPVAQNASPPVVVGTAAPVVVQQPPTVIHERDGTGDLVTGMMLGLSLIHI